MRKVSVSVKQCENCKYNSCDTDSYPCSKCLDSYIYLPNFEFKEEDKKDNKVESN